jgi:hypothetical protein
MRKALIFFSLILPFFFLSLLAYSQKLKSSFPNAKIQLSERFWDFGYVPEGIKVSRIFLIKNTGTDTLIISGVRSDCGCTHTPLSNSRIAPRQTTELELIFNPQKFFGRIRKGVSIFCNDTSSPSPGFAFTAQVGLENPMVKLNPEGILFGNLTPAHKLTKKMEIRNISETKLFISVAQEPKNFIDYHIEKLELLPEESTAVRFKLNPPLPSGDFRTSLALDFTGSEKIRCTIPIQGTVIK